MKKILTAIALVLIASTGVMAYSDENGYDVERRFTGEHSSGHWSHIGVGAAIGGSVWYLYPDHWNQTWRIPVAIGAAFAVGTIMELTDEVTDFKDVLEYTVPAAITVTILEITF